MSNTLVYTLFTLMGALCITGLAINGYFLKGLLESIHLVKVQNAVLIEKAELPIENKEEIKEIRKKLHNMNTMIHQMKSYELFKDLETET